MSCRSSRRCSRAADHTIDGAPLTVQPISIAYVQLDGVPLGRSQMPFFAWYGDMDLVGHLWRVAGLGCATAELTFHPPVTLAERGSRKALAEHCFAVVTQGVAASLAGRGRPPHMTAETTRVLAPRTDTEPQQDLSNHTVLDRAPPDVRVH